MQFFRFWSRADEKASGRDGEFSATCYGYSNESLEDAFRVAQRRAQRVATNLAQGAPIQGGYYEGVRPFREEIVEQFADDSGQTLAIISRNNYGALILNTPSVFFADVDKPPESERKSLFSFFRKPKEEPSFEKRLCERIDKLCLRESTLGMRLYRTAAGFRILITSRLVRANEANSIRLLESLGTDELYTSLCRTQDCYRARLTPKPWRCKFERPPSRFPFMTETAETNYRKWERKYASVITQYATCALIGEFGDSHRDPFVERIIQLHDHYSMDGQKPLA